MDAELARRRVTGAPVGHLATVTSEGRAHVVPCCFALEGDRIYTAVDAKAKSTLALRRLDNVRAHPGVSLLVDHYEDDWSALWWVRIDGTARVCESDRLRAPGLDALAAKYRQYREVTPPGAVIVLEIDRWRWWP